MFFILELTLKVTLKVILHTSKKFLTFCVKIYSFIATTGTQQK